MAFRDILKRILLLSPRKRRLLLIIADAVLLLCAVWLSFWLRLAHPFSGSLLESLWLLPSVLLIQRSKTNIGRGWNVNRTEVE